MSEPKKLICGMTLSAAQSYMDVRQEVDLLLYRMHQAGHRLSVHDITTNPDDPGIPLTQIGHGIMHYTCLIQSYLEHEFASLPTIIKAIQQLQPKKGNTP